MNVHVHVCLMMCCCYEIISTSIYAIYECECTCMLNDVLLLL